MKYGCCVIFLLLALIVPVQAAELPAELYRNLPAEAEVAAEQVDPTDPSSLALGIEQILNNAKAQFQRIWRERVRGAATILLIVILCTAVEGFASGTGGKEAVRFLPMAGALAITAQTAGGLHTLIGLGAETLDSLRNFSGTLLPTLAASVAAGGTVQTATIQQVTTVCFVDVLLRLIDNVLLPVVYLYIGTLTAGTMLTDNRLTGIADALKKGVTAVLSGALLLFTVYLSVVHIIAGSVDTAAVKVAKAAISGAVPVVGGIIAEASETVLAGAGLLKNTIGIVGTLTVLTICAVPFLQLGLQYILYKITGFFAGILGTSSLCKLIDGLGGAFGLILGMTGSCALLILISILSFMAAVTP